MIVWSGKVHYSMSQNKYYHTTDKIWNAKDGMNVYGMTYHAIGSVRPRELWYQIMCVFIESDILPKINKLKHLNIASYGHRTPEQFPKGLAMDRATSFASVDLIRPEMKLFYLCINVLNYVCGRHQTVQ